MCFHIIPLCPECEEPSGLGEEIIYSDDICCGHCPPEDVCGSTTRLMTQTEVDHPDFECSTPGCEEVRTTLTPSEEEAEIQRARDHAKRFLRETYEGCLSLCILPFVDETLPNVETTPEITCTTSFVPKRGQQWTREEEVALWQLRRQGMEFDDIARHIDRTERGCYDRYNKLRNEGFGRQ
ncbi:hypothetical protein VMCG_04724 [Cytospora schulzeri]|uniref:Myb-like domain-containing protein n=1 Tax=Cytospora schulzeri TaxID=448051 RepID=A0A423WN46_9PEZI|nr:hypothetical protein VMCG_04724 [Valsa malicola]